MDRVGIRSSYALSLAWVAAFVALAMSTCLVTELVFVDFIHVNPNRTQSNALVMMTLYPPILSIIAMVGVWLVFGPAHFLQAILAYALIPIFGRKAFLLSTLMLPIMGAVTWYSFDYLTPSNVGLELNDLPPYEHGISPLRFLEATGATAIVTAFTMAYCNTGYWRPSRKGLLVVVLIITILSGIVLGYRGAKDQYQFLNPPDIARSHAD